MIFIFGIIFLNIFINNFVILLFKMVEWIGILPPKIIDHEYHFHVDQVLFNQETTVI